MESTLDGHRIDFELKWNDLYRATLYRINRTPFAGWWMVDEQPSCNCWFSSQLSVYMVSNAKKKWKSWLNIIKNIWEEVILYCFQICFPVSENTPLFLSLNKIHVTKFMQAHIYISCFHFLVFVSKREILSEKSSVTDRFPLSLNREPKKCCWWNLKS